MQKLVSALIISFLVLGMLLHAPLVVAEEGNSTSAERVGACQTDVDCEGGACVSGQCVIYSNSQNKTSNLDDASEDDDSVSDDDEDDEDDFDKNKKTRSEIKQEMKEKIRERIEGCIVKAERSSVLEDGKRVIVIKKKIRCDDGRETEVKIKIENTTDGGRVREKIKYEFEGEDLEIEAGEGIDLEDDASTTEYKLRAKLRNGGATDIKIMPDTASKIALERLRSKNFTIELREKTRDNVPMVVYHIKSDKEGRFLGVFKLAIKVEGQVDPETGEFLGEIKPWWAFLVTGEDLPDESLIKGEAKVKAETFNGTSEVKVELEFATKEIEQEQIVNEILARLSELNVSGLLEVEESDEALEAEEKLEAEAEVEESFSDVEFELKFIVSSDNRESVINAVMERLSALTAEDINSVFELEVENEEELEDEEDGNLEED